MQRRLLLMRHAESGWSDESITDHQRPLNSKGKKDSTRIAQTLQCLNWVPNRVFVSDSKRTLSTLEGMNSVFGEVSSRTMESLYQNPLSTILECTQKANQGETTLILSHNPGTELVLYELTGEFHEMPTAAYALLIEKNGKWHCQQILRPKELD